MIAVTNRVRSDEIGEQLENKLIFRNLLSKQCLMGLFDKDSTENI